MGRDARKALALYGTRDHVKIWHEAGAGVDRGLEAACDMALVDYMQARFAVETRNRHWKDTGIGQRVKWRANMPRSAGVEWGKCKRMGPGNPTVARHDLLLRIVRRDICLCILIVASSFMGK